MTEEQKNAHFNALKLLLEKALSFSGKAEETTGRKTEVTSEGQKKITETGSKKEKEAIKNLVQMLAEQKQQKANKEQTFEKPRWIERARIAFSDMEELVLRHCLEALTVSDVRQWARLIVHEFVV